MAEADTEHGPGAREPGDDLVGHAGVVGCAWTGGDEHGVGFERDRFVDGDGVVAVHEWLGPELAEVLDEVVDEGVVVVDDEDAGSHSSRWEGSRGPRATWVGSLWRRPALKPGDGEADQAPRQGRPDDPQGRERVHAQGDNRGEQSVHPADPPQREDQPDLGADPDV